MSLMEFLFGKQTTESERIQAELDHTAQLERTLAAELSKYEFELAIAKRKTALINPVERREEKMAALRQCEQLRVCILATMKSLEQLRVPPPLTTGHPIYILFTPCPRRFERH